MKKKFLSLFACLTLIAILSIPAYAAKFDWCSCGSLMDGTTYYAPWRTIGYADCIHGHLYTKDALVERTVATTYVCRRCGRGYNEEKTERDRQCLATNATSLELPEGDTCPICLEDAVLTTTYKTSWATIATDENGNSEQKRTIAMTSVCGNCCRGGTTEETETRTIRLHKYQ